MEVGEGDWHREGHFFYPTAHGRQRSQLMLAAWEHLVDTGTNDYAGLVRQRVHRGSSTRHVNKHQWTRRIGGDSRSDEPLLPGLAREAVLVAVKPFRRPRTRDTQAMALDSADHQARAGRSARQTRPPLGMEWSITAR